MSTITTINGTDVISTSRTTINTNFSNLNTDKIETSVLDTDTSLTANSDVKIPSQKAVKAYVDSGGQQNASETIRGLVEEATDAEVTAGTATGGTGAKLFITPAKLATASGETGVSKIIKTKSTGLLDSSIIPLTLPFCPQDIPLVADANSYTQTKITSNADGSVVIVSIILSGTNKLFRLEKDSSTGNYTVTHSSSYIADHNGSILTWGLTICGSYVYVTYITGGAANKFKRLDLATLTNGTDMTVSGTFRNGPMWSDGTDLYIYNAGNFDKFTISGTTVTNASTVNFTSIGTSGMIANATYLWTYDGSTIKKYAKAGGAASSSTTFTAPIADAYPNNSASIVPYIFLGSATNLGVGFMFDLHSNTAKVGTFVHLMAITLP